MKKEYCLIAFLLFVEICVAQFPKGTKMLELSTNAQFSSYETENSGTYGTSKNTSDQYNFTFNPTYNFFIKENLMIGVGPSYIYVRQKNYSYYDSGSLNDNTSIINTNYFGANVFLRKYYVIKDNFYWYLSLESSYNYGIGTQINDLEEFDVKASNIQAFGSGGFAYDYNKKWLFRASIANMGWTYESTKSTNEEGTIVAKSNNGNFRFFGIYLSLGVSLILHE